MPDPASPRLDLRAPQPKKPLSHLLPWLWHSGWRWRYGGVFLLSDTLALAIAWQLARYLNHFYSPLPASWVWWSWLGIPSLFWVFSIFSLALLAAGGLYHSRSLSQDYSRCAQLVSLVYLLSLVLSYFYDPKFDLPRSLFFTAWGGSVVNVVGLRLLWTLIIRQFDYDTPQIRIFLIAPGTRLRHLAAFLKKRPHYQIVGAALASTAHSRATIQAIRRSGAQEVLAQDLPQSRLASTLFWQLRRQGVVLRLVPSSKEMLYRRGIPEIFAGLPTLRLELPLLLGWDYRLKRWLDVICASLGLLAISPLFIAVIVAIKITSPGPVFFRQERIGLHGRPFQMWKFRTMVINAEKLQAELEKHNENQDGIMFKMKHDPRITPIGNFLRRTSIDELPQLFNVVLGHMSLVGPRPLPLRDVQRFEEWHHIRHQVVPGITGLWQISGRSDITTFDEAIRLDLYYIDNWSLNLDMDILLETVRIVMFGKGAY